MKTSKNLSNHPTLVNDCYRIATAMNTASKNFRGAQDLMGSYSGQWTEASAIDAQFDEAIKALKAAAMKMEALKYAYKKYATEL